MDAVWAQLDLFRQKNQEDAYPRESEHFCTCGGLKVFNDDLLPTCTECGRSDGEYVSDEPEWRGGIDDDGTVTDPSRVGMPVDLALFSESWGMGTIVKVRYSSSLSDKKIARKNFHTSMNHKDRALYHAYEDFERAGKDTLGLPPNIIREAKIVYKKFGEEKLTRGAVRLGVKANCLLWACNMAGVPRTAKEVADAFGIQTKDVSRTLEIFNEVIQIKPKVKITFPSDVMARYMNDVDVVPEEHKRKVRMKVIHTCEKIQTSVALMGKTPKGVASAVMYTVLNKLGHKIDKQTVCKVCEVSLPTLNKLEPIVINELKSIVI
jgi:transcription initiation factor TFIIIB Brf1 subunit/transcription initiation factor TFIIB